MLFGYALLLGFICSVNKAFTMKNVFEEHKIADTAIISYLRHRRDLNISAIRRTMLPFLIVDCVRQTKGDTVIYSNGITYIFNRYTLATIYRGNTLQLEAFVPKIRKRKTSTQKAIQISAHATVRYIQRFMHVGLQHIVDEILAEKFSWAEGKNYCDGLTYHITNGVLMYITKKELTKKRYKIKSKAI